MGNVSSFMGSDKLSRLGKFVSDFTNIRLFRKLPSFYWNKVNNVGDRLNIYLLQRISGKEVYLVKTKKFAHILPVGSILHFSADSSYIWGSGLIAPDKPTKVKFARILALRGYLTLSEINRQQGTELDVPLGDPALLMPRYYRPNPSAKRYRIGIVPHYTHLESDILQPFRQHPDLKVISVHQDYDSFINELANCDYILSSSLHGLILSDAYGIPNKWISILNNLIGGEFKFKDYYSTTAHPEESCDHLKDTSDLLTLTECIASRASIKKYTGDLSKLEDSLRNYI